MVTPSNLNSTNKLPFMQAADDPLQFMRKSQPSSWAVVIEVVIRELVAQGVSVAIHFVAWEVTIFAVVTLVPWVLLLGAIYAHLSQNVRFVWLQRFFTFIIFVHLGCCPHQRMRIQICLWDAAFRQNFYSFSHKLFQNHVTNIDFYLSLFKFVIQPLRFVFDHFSPQKWN